MWRNNPEVVAEYWAIIKQEQWHHIDGIYYANLNDAEIQRIATAQRRVRDADRKARWELSLLGGGGGGFVPKVAA